MGNCENKLIYCIEIFKASLFLVITQNYPKLLDLQFNLLDFYLSRSYGLRLLSKINRRKSLSPLSLASDSCMSTTRPDFNQQP